VTTTRLEDMEAARSYIYATRFPFTVIKREIYFRRTQYANNTIMIHDRVIISAVSTNCLKKTENYEKLRGVKLLLDRNRSLSLRTIFFS
jgi:hypothetical protein